MNERHEPALGIRIDGDKIRNLARAVVAQEHPVFRKLDICRRRDQFRREVLDVAK